MTETKQEKFDRMLDARLPKAVKAIELLGNLANKSTYEWHGQQVDGLLDALEEAVDGVMDRFGVVPEKAPPVCGPPPLAREENRSSLPEQAREAVEDRPGAGDRRGQDLLPISGQVRTQVAPVDGVDRRDIRAALHKLTRGDNSGVKDLKKIVLGWSPEAWNIEEEN